MLSRKEKKKDAAKPDNLGRALRKAKEAAEGTPVTSGWPVKDIGTPDLKYVRGANFNDFDGPFLLITGTDFHYMPTGDIYHDLVCTEEFSRLRRIKQLGTVGASLLNACQSQNREFHSFVAAGMMDIVLHRNNFSEHERKLGIAAGLYHDLAILPYSDQGKLIKPGSYEEESLVEHMIKKSALIKEMLKKHGIHVAELIAAIQGKGIVGKLINSKEGLDADNLSYLAIDQSWMCSGFNDERKKLCAEKGIFDQYNNLWNIGGEWVFDNPALLTKLLKFRALMYRETYTNVANRAKEAFLIRMLKGQEIGLDEMLKSGDEDFERWFKRIFGHKRAGLFFNIGKEPFAEIGREYDLSKLEQLRKEKEKDGVIVEHLKPPRDATKNLVLHKGKVKMLEDIPEFSSDLQEVKGTIKSWNYIGIYKQVEE